MIVADVNLLAYLVLQGPFTSLAEQVLKVDAEWTAPAVWRHEFVNVLATAVREEQITLDYAMSALARADALVALPPVRPADEAVVRLAAESRHATYDCEFVVLARQLGVFVVSQDVKMCQKFGDVVRSLNEFVGESPA